MTPTRRQFLGVATASTALGVTGCLGGGDGTPTPTEDPPGGDETATATPTDANGDGDAGAEGATVQVRAHPEHGDVLVGPDGLTLYNFDSDEQGAGASTCTDGCAEAWPPLTVDSEPAVGEGVTAEVTTFERDDGSTQVAANGWPLYYYASDQEPGDVQGQGANDVWWVLGPDGVPTRPDEMGDQ